MVQGALTLMTRSLREGARLRRAHAFRILSVLLLFGMLIEAHAMSWTLGAPGLRLFRSIGWLAVGLITLAGFSYFASVISEEKEDGTLSLLKLADLSSLSIILGKSTSRLVAALLVFMAQFPFALLAITLGGVTVRQVWSTYVALAAYMILVANLALLCSVLSRRSGTASILVMLVLLAYLGLSPLLHLSRAALEQTGLLPRGDAVLAQVWDFVDFVYSTSILTRLEAILKTGYTEPAMSPQVWASLGGAFACFVTAWVIFDRYTEYVDSSEPARGMVPRRHSRRWGLVTRTWRWPLVWKDFHFVSGGPLLTGAKFIAYPVLLATLFYQQDWIEVVFGVEFRDAAWLAMVIVALCELLLYSTRIFRQERKWGTLPCLALLPRTMPAIGYAKLGGCLLGSVPTMLMFAALAWIVPLPNSGSQPWYLEPEVAFGLVMVALVLQLTALYSLMLSWGALPLALATLLVSGTCIFPVLAAAVSAVSTARQGDYAQLGPILYTGGVLSAALQLLIGLQFRAAASQ